MSLFEHLTELRARIIKAPLGLVAVFAISLTFTDPLWRLICRPASPALRPLGYPPVGLHRSRPVSPRTPMGRAAHHRFVRPVGIGSPPAKLHEKLRRKQVLQVAACQPGMFRELDRRKRLSHAVWGGRFADETWPKRSGSALLGQAEACPTHLLGGACFSLPFTRQALTGFRGVLLLLAAPMCILFNIADRPRYLLTLKVTNPPTSRCCGITKQTSKLPSRARLEICAECTKHNIRIPAYMLEISLI